MVCDMMAGVVVFAALWIVLCSAPRTPIVRFLHRFAVAAPARWLNGIRRGTMIVTFLLLLIGAAMTWLMQGEGTLLFGMAMPEIAGMLLALDVAAYVDVLIAVTMASSAVRLRAVRGWLRARPLIRRRARTWRARRVAAKAANDDAEHDGLAVAA